MSKEIKEKEVQVKEKEVQVEETQETKVQAEEQKKVVETTAEVVETRVKIPAKVRVGNFVRKHRTAIVGAVTGLTGLVTGIVLGVKIGKDQASSVDTAELPGITGVDALPDQDYNSIPIDIPENTK